MPELERLLEQLIAIPSVMGDETTKAKFLADYLSDWEPELQPVVDGTVNLWCHAPGDGAVQRSQGQKGGQAALLAWRRIDVSHTGDVGIKGHPNGHHHGDHTGTKRRAGV